MAKRTVYFVSDQTGVTAETLGHSLLTQFDGVEFRTETVPFVNDLDKAMELTRRIDRNAARTGRRPIVFTSFVQDELRAPLLACRGLVLDLFAAFIGPLEDELEMNSSHTLGRAHGMTDVRRYDMRISAMNFAMDADDGHGTRQYDRADVILTGVSRSGKTPTCLYLGASSTAFSQRTTRWRRKTWSPGNCQGCCAIFAASCMG